MSVFSALRYRAAPYLSAGVDKSIAHFTQRPCDLSIGGEPDPYMRRWFITRRRTWWVNCYLHNVLKSDEDRALHDHPAWNISILLKGGYVEIMPTRGGTTVSKYRGAGSIVFRTARTAHRLVITEQSGPVWTIWISGPKLRQWGFWCPKGWVLHSDFTAGERGELIGRGCGEP